MKGLVQNRWALAAILTAMMALAIVASLAAGRVWLAPALLLQGLVEPGEQLSDMILFQLRLPRAILAVLIGAALGVSGAALQGLLRNPLAEPGLLGVSSGASLGAVIAIYFGLSHAFAFATPILGLAGAMAAGALTFSFGRGGGTLALILAGSAVSSLAMALVALALNFAPNPYAAYEITLWMLGSLNDRSWDHVLLAAPFVVVGVCMLLAMGRSIDALSLGEVQARSLGVNLERTHILTLVGTGMAVGAATSISGSVGFVGLVAPHLVRPFVGHQPGRTLVPSALLGATLVLTADVLTRVIRVSSEVRLGVLTSLIGLPFFFWLVLKMKKTAP